MGRLVEYSRLRDSGIGKEKWGSKKAAAEVGQNKVFLAEGTAREESGGEGRGGGEAPGRQRQWRGSGKLREPAGTYRVFQTGVPKG